MKKLTKIGLGLTTVWVLLVGTIIFSNNQAIHDLKLNEWGDFLAGAAAAEQGEADAQYNIGGVYYQGIGVPKDFKRAMEWYRKAANQGFAGAQFNLGHMYSKGLSVTKNNKEAAKWYRQAAEQGIAQAQTSIGTMYYLGSGVPRDLKEAARWYHKAAEQGIAIIQFQLGAMYHMGEGVQKSYIEAYKWYAIAESNGVERARQNKVVIQKHMASKQIAEAQKLAREWMEEHGKE